MIGPYLLKKGTRIYRYDNWQKGWFPFVTTKNATYSTVDVVGQSNGTVRLSIPSKRYTSIEVHEKDLYLVGVTSKGTKKRDDPITIVEATSKFNRIWNEVFDPEAVVKTQMMKAIADQLDKKIMGE